MVASVTLEFLWRLVENVNKTEKSKTEQNVENLEKKKERGSFVRILFYRTQLCRKETIIASKVRRAISRRDSGDENECPVF